MDKINQKSNKDRSKKNVDKEKTSLFTTDVKAIKENLKIKEILRTVKMNSSMRLKAPRGSKVMQNKDFNDNEDFEEVSIEDECASEPPSATNPNVITDPPQDSTYEETSENCTNNEDIEVEVVSSDTNINNQTADTAKLCVEPTIIHKSNSFSESSTTMSQIENESETNTYNDTLLASNDYIQIKSRDRKLSLDHTMLRREGLSQSELDLHSIGKSPLERKSSFFRKKMGSFFKNTTEIFKRQSLGTKSPTIQRRGSMSVSLQSLNEKATSNGNCSAHTLHENQKVQGSMSSLQSSLTTGLSNTSLSRLTPLTPDAEEYSFACSQPTLNGSQPIGDISNSVNSLNELHIPESLMNSRAISMSSGLDSAHGKGRRKASRSNRVTWLASEGLTNYFRRQEERFKDMQVCYSYQDFSTIPENTLCGPNLDSKGRRLSYQRAVSGEDPVSPVKYQESLKRKPYIPENHMRLFGGLKGSLAQERRVELAPERKETQPSQSYNPANILKELDKPNDPIASVINIKLKKDAHTFYIKSSEDPAYFENYMHDQEISPAVIARQSVIRELIITEADYIRYLELSLEVFIDTAVRVQYLGYLKDVDFGRLFINFPDVLQANLKFWEESLSPMISNAVDFKLPYNTELMLPAFLNFDRIFEPYKRFVSRQKRALDYLRNLSAYHPDFYMYLQYCHKQEICNRLQLSDILAKPMQRLTKYNLILQRILSHTERESERSGLETMVNLSTRFLHDVNRKVRQMEEIDIMSDLGNSIESYDIEFKDEDLEKVFKYHSIFNLQRPMQIGSREVGRTLIFQMDLRFRDNQKEMDVRGYLLTDLLLICKKQSKSTLYPYKLIRPKYLLEKLVPYPRYGKNKELVSITYVVLDDFQTAYQCFNISETNKDPNYPYTLKQWEQKYREAQLTYKYLFYCTSNDLDCNISKLEEATEESFKMGKMSSDQYAIERDARERVVAMLHVDPELVENGSLENEEPANGEKYAARYRRLHSTAIANDPSSKESTSATSEEPQPGPSRPFQPEKSITPDGPIMVQVIGPDDQIQVKHEPMLVLEKPIPGLPKLRSPGVGNMLYIQPKIGVIALMHSLPDLTIEPFKPRSARSHNPQSSSDKRFKSNQELQLQNRLSTSQHHQFLSPDHRGASYPPPSPTRASLQRGQAISDNNKSSRLSKMSHVNSQSEGQAEAEPVTTQPRLVKDEPSTSGFDHAGVKAAKNAGDKAGEKAAEKAGEKASSRQDDDDETSSDSKEDKAK